MKGGKIKVFIPKAVLRKLYIKRKLPLSQIRLRYGCSLNTISYWLRKYKIRIRTPSQAMRLFSPKLEIPIDKHKLQDLVINKRFKLSKIAKKYNCKIPTVLRRLRKYKINHRFSNCKKIEINKDTLKKLYSNRKLSTYEIAEYYGVCQTTIWKKLKLYRIKIRSANELNSNIPSKKFLKDYYIKKRLSTWEIEKRYGFNRSTVHRKLRKYGMVRSRAEAHTIYPKKDFDGNLKEKAYLIGFRIGDLRVRKIWKNSETILVDCGSPIPQQIKLINSLFRDYGRVWIKEINGRKGCFQIEVSLNKSFAFLLSKKIPAWIWQNKNIFFSFLGGFSDAEGCFSINKRNQAFYSLGNYNSYLLRRIRRQLLEQGIKCSKLSVNYTKGKLSSNGYISNGDYYRLSINGKNALMHFFNEIQPYIKHEEKIKNLNLSKRNIIERNRRFK